MRSAWARLAQPESRVPGGRLPRLGPVRTRGTALAILVVVGLAAACSEPADERSAPTSTGSTSTTAPPPTVTVPSATTTTSVVLPDPVPIVWVACGGGFDCATVAVPTGYADPTGPTLELALVRNPADDPDRRIGTLLMNPGGPGASGVRRVARGFRVSTEVAARFDIVGFDPRGIGDSTPITCGSSVPAFRAADLAPDTPAEEDALAAAAQAVAQECIATEGDRLGHLGTVEVVHDMEVIRRAIGEDRISFVGLSYGTLLGQLWADWYPRSVRALVLDGVIDPGTSGVSSSIEQVRGVDDVIGAIADACSTDPACPVSGTGGLLASYDELARRIEAKEVSGSGVGPTQLAYAAFYATYDVATWPRFWEAVALGLGGDLSPVGDLAASFTTLVPYTPFAIVSCLDNVHPIGYEKWKQGATRIAEASPRFGRTLANELLPCAYWPAATYRARRVVAAGAPPILVIGSTDDAATPYASAVDVARSLSSGALLTVDLEGHVALGDSDCADDAATRYLVDLIVPEPGARC